jgi:uncharacterized protein YbcV (DUF1398 family)
MCGIFIQGGMSMETPETKGVMNMVIKINGKVIKKILQLHFSPEECFVEYADTLGGAEVVVKITFDPTTSTFELISW